MSEVDRLSTSGLYPALPIGDRRRSKKPPGEQTPGDQASTDQSKEESGETGSHRIPKSLIDDYA